MKTIIAAGLGAALLVGCATTDPVMGPKTAQSTDPFVDLPAFVDGVLALQLTGHEVAGATVVVVHDGEIVLERGYGFADVEAGTPVDPVRTLFRPGSTSKLFTWTALMQEVEAGRVHLDDDVNEYLDFTVPSYGDRPVTVRDLMSHTPGWSDVSGISAETPDDLVPFGEWLAENVPEAVWPPGTEISYSNYGVALAGYIVERTSGMSFADYTEAHIFAPLGMTSTTFVEPLPPALLPRMATGYEIEEGQFVGQPFELFGNIMPAGSSSSTARDMAQFIKAMTAGGALGDTRILSEESVGTLTSNTVSTAPDLPGMAHGYYVVREAGPRIVGHGGNTGDFNSMLWIAPEAETGVFLSYTGGPKSHGARTDLANLLIGRLFPEDPLPRIVGGADAVMPEGTYRVNRRNYARPPRSEYDITVRAAGDDAILMINRGAETYWERVGPATFERVTGSAPGGPYEQVAFTPSADGVLLSFSSQPFLAYRRLPKEDPSP